ncbi:MAG: methyltransferase domain-containing protein [Butyrivibrio sp.]|nr:methyltransferase domain-containing protein [Butyrivibrio sp.]
MEAYTDFAVVYDTFMDETPYDVWGDFVDELIKKYGISKAISQEVKQDDKNVNESDEEAALEQEKNLVVELGCGTGSFTLEMAKRGYDIMGIDLSSEMLDIARRKSVDAGFDLMFLEQDMRELDLYCTAGTIVSVCDSINYLTEDSDVIDCFKLVNNFLFPGGIFIFDFNTVYKYKEVIGDTTIAENREDCSFIWENYYDEESHINEYDLTIFARCDKNDEIFRRSIETHYQRGYTLEEMKHFIEVSGLEFVTAIDADTHEAPVQTSERIYIIAREITK